MKNKGWRNESRRHSLASKGIKTAQKLGKVGTLSQGKTYLHWDDLPKDEKDHFIVAMGINNEEEFKKYLKKFGMKQRPPLPKKWKKSGLYNNIPNTKTYYSGQIENGNAKEVLVLRENPHDLGWVVFKYENRYEPNVGVVRGDIQQRKSFKTKKQANEYLMRLVK